MSSAEPINWKSWGSISNKAAINLSTQIIWHYMKNKKSLECAVQDQPGVPECATLKYVSLAYGLFWVKGHWEHEKKKPSKNQT